MTHETKTMTAADDLKMLGLYRHLAKSQAEREAAEKVYFAEKMREQRAMNRAAKADGRPRTTPRYAREALADAAMRILAANGPGSDAVREALLEAFASTPAYVSTIEALVVKGKLRPKYVPLRKPPAGVSPDGSAKVLPMVRREAPAADDGFQVPDFLKRDSY